MIRASKHASQRFDQRFRRYFPKHSTVPTDQLIGIVLKASEELQSWKNVSFIWNSFEMDPTKDNFFLFDKRMLFVVKKM